ncbi:MULTISPECIES: hypothetical protein [Streptomyces]|nr:hypothetical protein [Streptomyces sp. FXJ1.172]WEP00791.1 hypothetical protein A6P39_042220 [Streptomyces sp. FXJ1.172]
MATKIIPRGKCCVRGRPYQLEANGTVRVHWARAADGTAAPVP